MKKRFTFIVLLFTLMGASLCAQSVWTGDVDSDWSNAANWSGGVPVSGSVATIPASPQGGNFPIYSGSPIVDFTIQNLGELTFNSLIFNQGSIINFTTGQIYTSGDFINANGKLIDNDGVLEISGKFTNYGTLDHAASGSLLITSTASLVNFATLRSNGPIQHDGTLENYSNFRSTNTFQNNGIFINAATSTFTVGSTFTHNVGATFTNLPDGVFDTNSTFTSNNDVDNQGTFILSTAGVFNNNARVDNIGDFEMAGLFNNDGTFFNPGKLLINDLGRFENNSSFNNGNQQGTIETSVCGIFVHNAGNDIRGTILNEGIIYEISTGSLFVTTSELGEKFSNINDLKPPVAGCRAGVIVQLDENGAGVLEIDDIDKGSYGQCGAQISARSISKTDFTTADIGDQFVTLTITDEFDNTSTCDAVVSIRAFVEPIVPTDDPSIATNCPADITVTTLPGGGTAVANWDEPTATSDCSVNGCDEVPDNISGFTFLGEFDGSKYFLANQAKRWNDAKRISEDNGGRLLEVNSAAENEFIKDKIRESIFIGLTDQAREGRFEWVSGDPVDFTNWNSGEPNDYRGREDVVEMFTNGRWNDQNKDSHRKYVLEIPCGGVSTITCEEKAELAGFKLIGSLGDSKYYSYPDALFWHDARILCESAGGHLLVINNKQENDYIKGLINESVILGLTDSNTDDYADDDNNSNSQEGNFTWVNGDPLTYTNWNSYEPNNYRGNEDYTEMYTNGRWNDYRGDAHRKFILELNCKSQSPAPIVDCSEADQISGLKYAGTFNNSHYYISNAKNLSWHTSKKRAEEAGGHLVTISSKAENDFVQSIITHSFAWIGFTDEAQEGNFVWANGEPVVYTNWKSGEPNNSEGAGNFTRLLRSSGEWTDLPSRYRAQYVVEISCPQTSPNVEIITEIDCSSPKTISGLTYVGTFNNHFYYRSNGTNFSWTTAERKAREAGGYLAVIGSAEENEYIRSNMSGYSAWHGLTDKDREGQFVTVNGEPVVYTNWRSGEPNNGGGDEHFARILKDNGQWTDRDAHFRAEYFVEIPCPTIEREVPLVEIITEIDCSSPETISGLTYIGAFNDHFYYRSNGTSFSWATAERKAREAGGYLAVIGSAEENEYIRSNMSTHSAWHGLTDKDREGQFVTVNGEPVVYTNWRSGEPNNNGGDEHFARILKDNGQWTDRDAHFRAEYFVEIPCPTIEVEVPISRELTIEQISGPDNGSTFILGTTEIAYRITDPCGKEEICVFNVVVEQTPVDFNLTSCPQDITVTAEPGADSAPASWALPTATTDCFRSSVINLDQTLGLESGSDFPIGTSQIAYAVFDSCGGFEVCSFNVTVVSTPEVFDITCPSDILVELSNGTTDAQVSWTEPVVVADCIKGGAVVTQLQGPANGSTLQAGVYPVAYLIVDGCNNTSFCFFTIDIVACAPAGTPCNDGDPSTFNDVEDGSCGCAGVPVPACPSTENLALNKTAIQSSTQLGAVASRAVDGDTNGDFFAGLSISQTNFENQPWLEVDLGDILKIEDVNVWNRSDCCTDQLQNFYILVSDVPFTSTDLTQTLNQPGVDGFFQAAEAVRPSNLTINRFGRYVRIQLQGAGFLSMSELEINGCALSSGANGWSNKTGEVLVFNAYKAGMDVELDWITNTEFKNDRFLIERSENGREFAPLMELDSRVNSLGTYNYQQKDITPMEGSNYYRLRQIHQDGSEKVSAIKLVNFEGNPDALILFPNPTVEQVNINLRRYAGQQVSIEIYDALGRLVATDYREGLAQSILSFDTRNYIAGIYTMSIQIGDRKRVNRKFIVARP